MMKHLERYNPGCVFLYFMLVTLPVMFLMHPVMVVCSFCGAFCYQWSCYGRSSRKTMLWNLILFLACVLLTPLFSHNGEHILFYINDNPVTAEAFFYGTVMAGLLLSVLCWFRSFSKLMTADRLLYVFGKLSPKLSMLLSMCFRYIPLFRRYANKILLVQQTSGRVRKDTLLGELGHRVGCFSILVTWGLENGIVTADSMEARGYSVGRRTSFSVFRFRRRDAVFLVVILLLFAIMVTGILIGGAAYTIYPRLCLLGDRLPVLLVYTAYGGLCALPTLFTIEEQIRCHYLQSKI